MPATDLAGLSGVTLLMLVLLMRVPRVRELPRAKRAAALVAAVIAVSVPLWGVTPAGFLRGTTGDLSVTSLCLLGMALLRSLSGFAAVSEQNRLALLRAVLIAAVLFYPFALGVGMLDPYRLGYGNLWFLAALLGFAIWSAWRFSTLLAICIALAVAAWSAGWYESTNLWDYLMDPWLAIYAFVVNLKFVFARWKERKHA